MPSKNRSTSSRSRRALLAQAPDAEAVARAEGAGDGDDAMLLVRQEIAARILARARLHGLAHLVVRQSPSSPNSRRPNSTSGTVSMSNTSVFIARLGAHGLASPCRVLARAFVGAVSSTATATIRPASSVSVTCPPPMPSLRRIFSPRAE